MFKKLLLWHRRRTYRPGCTISRFIAPDVRREVEVIDATRIAEGVITARVRTWNHLYSVKGLVPKPEFNSARELRIDGLWKWTGHPWGGPIPESDA